jgi:hypothetical protein
LFPLGRAKGGEDSFWRTPVAPVPAASIVARLHIRCNASRIRSGADPHRLTTAHSAYFLSLFQVVTRAPSITLAGAYRRREEDEQGLKSVAI